MSWLGGLLREGVAKAGALYEAPVITGAERALTKEGSAAVQAFVGLVKETFMQGEQYKGQVFNAIEADVKKIASKGANAAREFNEFHQKGIVPKDSETGFAAVKQKNIGLTLFTEANKLGIKTQPLVVPNYFPSMIKDELLDTPEGRQQLIDHFVAAGKTPQAAAQALGFIERNGETPLTKTFHPFESPRRGKLAAHMVRDDLGVYPDYLLGASERIGRARVAGPNGEKLKELLEVIRSTDGEATYQQARRAASEKLGISYFNKPDEAGWERGMRAGVAATTLHLAPIANTSGGVANMVTLMGLKNFASGVAEIAKDRVAAAEWTNQAGPSLYQGIKELKRITGAENESYIGALARKTFMHPSENMARNERVMRTLGSIVGKNSAINEFEALLKNPSNELARRRLNVLGIDVNGALRRGSLDNGDLSKASFVFSNKTMLNADAFELPESWRNSAASRILTMYKPFLFLQTKFVRDEILKPAFGMGVKQDLRPLIWAAVMFPTLGEIAGDIKSLARGRGMEDRPDFSKYPADRIVDNIAQVGGLGIAHDITNAMAVGTPIQSYQFLTGPVIGTGVDLMQLPFHTAQQNLNFGLRRVPVVGPLAATAVAPPKKRVPGPLEKGLITNFLRGK